MKSVKSLEELQLYTDSSDAKIAHLKVRQFTSKPVTDAMAVVFHYPSTTESLSHFQVRLF